ncbi:hypothetical protein PI125_g7988 [Phytophthora idaei]|nr:hypothetical protein PI125_g7988 [Phytophthora idaei]
MTYTVTAPKKAQRNRKHGLNKLKKWAIAILIASSKLEVGEALGTPR